MVCYFQVLHFVGVTSLAFHYLGIYFQATLQTAQETVGVLGKSGKGQNFMREINTQRDR